MKRLADFTMPKSYSVSGSDSGFSGDSVYSGGYSNYAYNGHEMMEYANKGANRNQASLKTTFNGTGNTVGYGNGFPRDGTDAAKKSKDFSRYGNGGPSLDDDDEEDRGHWGSKAEFILSCIGFSVCSEK